MNRALIAVVLLAAEIASWAALSITPRDDTYYIVCGSFNLYLCIAFPYFVNAQIARDFQWLNLAQLIVQAFGFFAYWYQIPVEFYNYLIYLISALEVMRLCIKRKGDDDGLRANPLRRAVVRHLNFFRA